MVIIKEEKLSRFNPSNFSSMEAEVQKSEYSDWKRDVVDDAKKRAIYTAPSYDQFEQLVKGCTLKPIHRNEWYTGPKNQQVNRHSGGVSSSAGGALLDRKKWTEGGVKGSDKLEKPDKRKTNALSLPMLEKQLNRCGNEREKQMETLTEFFREDPQLEFMRSTHSIEPEFLEKVLRCLAAERQDRDRAAGGGAEDDSEKRLRSDSEATSEATSEGQGGGGSGITKDGKMDVSSFLHFLKQAKGVDFAVNFLDDDCKDELRGWLPEWTGLLA